MAANGISTLAFKNRRQNAKLAAASTKRATTSRRSTLNINKFRGKNAEKQIYELNNDNKFSLQQKR